MTANLFDERFYSLRQPAWHGLGTVSQEDLGAVEAFSRITPYDIGLKSLFIREGKGYKKIGNRAIVRDEVPDDPVQRVFGVVGPEYQLISPLQVCETYDQAITRPVETIGALGQGETLFLTTQLPEIDVKGDIVENYLLIVSPYTGLSAVQIRVTPVRVVCQNTLIAAKSASTEVYRLIHDNHAQENLQKWLVGLYDRAVQKAEVLTQAFQMFASFKPDPQQVQGIVEETYPHPKPMRQNAPEDVLARRQVDFDYYFNAAERNRSAVLELFQGKGTGMDLEATQGTGWGLYNAVTEWEDYRPTGKDTNANLVNALFGDRAAAKERAYVTIASYAEDAA